MSISGILAITNQTTNGELSTGIVDIKIQNYKIDNNGQEIAESNDNQEVMPGETISLIPKIHNLGMECYVRMKVTYIDENIDFSNYVTGLSNDLTKHGNYYYYNKVLNPGENIKIFDTIRIPENLDQNNTEKELKLIITAEAVQYRNFEPDYSQEDPWKGVTPTKTIKNSYEINDKGYKITIEYEDGANNDILVPNNFLDKMNTVLPGDSFKDSIKINNNSQKRTKYYIKLGHKETRTNEKELLKQVNLIITNKEGKIIYNGNLVNRRKNTTRGI